MIQTIEYKGIDYPAFQSNGNAARFCRPFAQEVCVGHGVDVGCNRHEWVYIDRNGVPALAIDKEFNDPYDALNLPPSQFDYIHSSHCLEHIPDWVSVLDYWYSKLKKGGVLFLYLPDYSQTYWRPWSNRKHVNILVPDYLRDYLTDKGYAKVFVSGVDLYNSFMVMAEK